MTTAKINIVETVAATTAAYTVLTNADTAPVNITDINGNPTGWTIQWSTGFAPGAGGAGYNGVGAGDALWADEADVLVESVFHNSFSANTYSEIIIEGPEQLTISAVGSYQDSTSHPDTEIWVNGGAVQTMLTYDSVNARGNNTDTADFIDVLKDVNNQFVIRFRHKTGTRGYLNGLQLVSPAAADTTAPTFSSAPAVTETTENGHTIAATLDEAGTLYGVRLANGVAAPTSAQVKAGQNSTGSAAPEAKSAAAANSASLVFSTGSASTAYDYYVVAEDDEGTPNVQASPTLVEATTAATAVPGISALTVQKDGVAVQASDWSINITLVAGGTEVYSGSSIASDASGVIAAINASSGSVGDAVRVEGYSAANNYGFVFTQNLENNA